MPNAPNLTVPGNPGVDNAKPLRHDQPRKVHCRKMTKLELRLLTQIFVPMYLGSEYDEEFVLITVNVPV